MTKEEEKAVITILGHIFVKMPSLWFEPKVKEAMETLGWELGATTGYVEAPRMPYKRLADGVETYTPNACAKCGTDLSGDNVVGSLCSLCTAYENDL